MACMAPEASCQTVLNDNTAVKSGYVRHPWAGKRVGYIGDSITDPKNNSNDIRQKYWAYLQQWLGITPYVYGISGRQWDDVPRQAEKLSKEHGNEVDAVVVFMGTNDFNAGVPSASGMLKLKTLLLLPCMARNRCISAKNALR